MQWELGMNLRPEVGIESCHIFYTPHQIRIAVSPVSPSNPYTTTGKIYQFSCQNLNANNLAISLPRFPKWQCNISHLIKKIIIGTEIPRIIAPLPLRRPQALDWLASFRDLRISYCDPLSSRQTALQEGHARGAVLE